MKSNTLTIIKKEFARFFGDRQLLFTTVIMPGLLIYIIYSLMGTGIQKMVTEGASEVVTLQVENMPQSLAPMFYSFDSSIVVMEQAIADEDIAQLEDKENNAVLVRFPENFEKKIHSDNSECSENSEIPNVELFYNSTNNASSRVYMVVSTLLNNYASVHKDHAVADCLGKRHLMRYYHHRHLLFGKLTYYLQHFAGKFRV